MLTRVCMAGAVALILTGCAGAPKRVVLEPATTQKLTEVKVLNILSQDEIIVRADQFGASAALGGGLLGAMIDSKVGESRQNSLQDTMAPFYQAVDDYNFRISLERVLDTTLSGATPLKFSHLESTALPHFVDAMVARTATLPAGSGLMFISTDYAFTSDFTRLNLSTRVEIKLPGADTPAFLNTFHYISAPAGTDSASSMNNWSANKGATYRTTMEEAAQEISKMLLLDLVANATDPQGAAKVTIEKSDTGGKLTIKGTLLANNPGRRIVRNEAGNLYSLPQ